MHAGLSLGAMLAGSNLPVSGLLWQYFGMKVLHPQLREVVAWMWVRFVVGPPMASPKRLDSESNTQNNTLASAGLPQVASDSFTRIYLSANVLSHFQIVIGSVGIL